LLALFALGVVAALVNLRDFIPRRFRYPIYAGVVVLLMATAALVSRSGGPGILAGVWVAFLALVVLAHLFEQWRKETEERKRGPLGTPALQEIFGRLLAEKGLRLAPGADRAVQIQIEERRAQGADEFDNAYAIRRLVDDVLYSHGLRMRGAPASPEQTPIVTADDVRNARSSL
jgi:hypothetical protein